MAEKTSPNCSKSLFELAQQYIPGGVNSPVRAFQSVGGTPRFIQSASGAYITDADGQQYIDYVGSWGPMILGHAHPAVIKAVVETAEQGLSFGAPCALEVELAKLICQRIPSIEKVRMVNSGTEATMSAVRVARGYTGRDKIVKFEGCYHGHADSFLVKAGSGALTCGEPNSPGVPTGSVEQTLTATFNDLDSVTALFEQQGDQIACIIVEPIAGNMGMVLPKDGFLQGLRHICSQHDSLLIFDEVMTGFRVGPQGAQGLYGISPDLTTFGKIIGGGMPVGAFGGSAEIMSKLAPEGPIYQAGTLSGNPVAMAAGLATLKELNDSTYDKLAKTTQTLTDGIKARADSAGIPMAINHVCGMFGVFFTNNDQVDNFAQVMACSQPSFNQYFHNMLGAGIYIAPSAFEAGFVSLAHGDKEIEQTLDAVEQSLEGINGI